MRLRTAFLLSSLALVLAGQVACTGAPRQRPVKGGDVDEGPGSVTMGRKFLEGRWTLQSFEVFPPSAAPVKLTGQGTLNYDDFGNMRIEIRADDKSADILRAAGIHVQDNMISTDGRTAIDMKNRTLTYIVGGQNLPKSDAGPLALSRPRHWEVNGDELILTTKDADGKALSVGRWKRMP